MKEYGYNKRKVDVAEPLNANSYGDFVRNKPDGNMRNKSVMLEHARPIFPAVRVILFLSTKIGASISFKMRSGRRI